MKWLPRVHYRTSRHYDLFSPSPFGKRPRNYRLDEWLPERTERDLLISEILERMNASLEKNPEYHRLLADNNHYAVSRLWDEAHDAAVAAVKADRKAGRRLLTDRFRNRLVQPRGRPSRVTDAALARALHELHPRQRRNASEATRWLAVKFPELRRDSLRRRLSRIMKKVGNK